MPQATPAPTIRIEPTSGGAESPGNISTTSPVTATINPTIWIASNRSPLRKPHRIMVAWTAPKSSKAPVPAERSRYANEKAAAYIKSARAEDQLPSFFQVALRIFMMSQSVAAPENIRTKVNVAASMLVCFSAARQRSELLAKAIIASDVRPKIREDFIASLRANTKRTPNAEHPTSNIQVSGQRAQYFRFHPERGDDRRGGRR